MMAERNKSNFKEYYDILGDPIGIGGFGRVYKGEKKETKEKRAIKIIDLDRIKIELDDGKKSEEEIEDELKSIINGFIKSCEKMELCSKNNENSVKYYEYFQNENSFVIIMELCDTNLSNLLNEKLLNTNKGFSIEEIKDIMIQLNKGFKKMKDNNIIHRNLKLENILIKYNNNKNIIKITDYGSSKRLISLSKNCNTNVGTTIYMAPEILEGKEEYNYKCDLWSIGIILYKLYFGIFPYNGDNKDVILSNINTYGKKLIEKTGNIELDDLINHLLEKETSKRLNWEQYFNHSFFNNIG